MHRTTLVAAVVTVASTFCGLIAAQLVHESGNSLTARNSEQVSQEAPLAHSASLPSGNFVIVEGNQITVCYTSTSKAVNEFCEQTPIVDQEVSLDGY